MEVFVVMHRGRDHVDDHSERMHLIGVYDNHQRAESAAENLIKVHRLDFRRISIIPMTINDTRTLW